MRRKKMGEFIIKKRETLFTLSTTHSDEPQSDVIDIKEASNDVEEKSTPEVQQTESNGTSSNVDEEEKCDTRDTTAIDVLSSNAEAEQQTQNNKNGKTNNNNKKGKKNAKGKSEVPADEEPVEVEA